MRPCLLPTHQRAMQWEDNAGAHGDIEARTEWQMVATMKLCKPDMLSISAIWGEQAARLAGSKSSTKHRKSSTSTLKERLTEHDSAG